MSTSLTFSRPTAITAPLLLHLPDSIRSVIGDECNATVQWLKGLMIKLDAVQGHGMRRRYEELAKQQTRKISGERLRKYHDAWKLRGVVALIDHRTCLGNCGQSDCGNVARKSMLYPATIAAWIKLAQQYKANGNNPRKSRSYKDAWRVLIGRLCEGEIVAGVAGGLPGTWKDIHMRLFPTLAVPETCPWSPADPPHALTLQNFMRYKPSQSEHVAATAGISELRELLPQVRFDYSKVRPQEYLLIDDKRIDVTIWMRVDGVPQFVELYSLMVMDLCSRRILWCQLHPKYTRPDGTEAGISLRDVQHMVAHVLRAYGHPNDYDCTFVCENATAKISEQLEDLLLEVSGGRVKVRRTGLWNGSVMIAGFAERGGKPRDKAPLESYFGHRWDIAFGRVRGQIGGDYRRLPGEAAGRALEAGRIVRVLKDGAASDEEFNVVLPYESVHTIRPFILEALNAIETRTDHDLQGFERVTRWRWSMGDAEGWKPMHHKALLSMGPALANELLKQPGCTEDRMESPVERWDRLRRDQDFTGLSPEAVAFLWMDVQTFVYDGRNLVHFDLPRKGGEFEFRGVQHSMQVGRKYRCHFDADAPAEGCWLMDERGVRAGALEWSGLTYYGDEQAAHQQLGEAQRQFHESLGVVRKTHQDRPTTLDLIEETRGKLDVVTTVKARAPKAKAATGASLELAQAMGGQAKAKESSSQRYLRRAAQDISTND